MTAPVRVDLVEEDEVVITEIRLIRRRVVTPAPQRYEGFVDALTSSRSPLRVALAKVTRGTR